MTWRKCDILNLLLALFAIGMANDCYAQAPIIVNPDNSVTITFLDSDAKEVKIQGTFFKKGNSIVPMAGVFAKEGKASMEQTGDGVWTYASKPLDSELYWYDFVIDGDSVTFDHRNRNTVRDIETIYNYFIIPGGIADDYVYTGKKQGSIEYVWYPSTINGMKKRRMCLYLPHGYHSNQSERYPVLYLLHGSGGDETSWTDCGRIAQILDNMIEQGRCKPMIVVMPNGNVDLAAAPGEDPDNPDVKPSGNNISSMFGKFEKAFCREIVWYVDKNYRTIPNKDNRAIAGLSLGGLHTLFTSVNYPDEFGYVGLFSAQTTNALDKKKIGGLRQINEGWNNLKNSLPFLSGTKLDEKITDMVGDTDGHLEIYDDFDEKLEIFFDKNPKLFYIAVGKDDFTKKLNDDLRKKLAKKEFPFVYNETDGAHTWSNWRKYIVDFLPQLFD